MKNAAISIRARLLNHSRLSGLPFNDVLEQYALGRFFGGSVRVETEAGSF